MTVLQRLIDDAQKIDAATALEWGLVGKVVAPEDLVRCAKEIAREWVALGKGRPYVEMNLLDKLLEVNKRESKELGDAVTNPKFFKVQMRRAQAKGKTKEAWVFWSLIALQPILSRL